MKYFNLDILKCRLFEYRPLIARFPPLLASVYHVKPFYHDVLFSQNTKLKNDESC